ncbi:MAG: phenylacetate--CoA ligase family protein [Limisphaerales bacterium]
MSLEDRLYPLLALYERLPDGLKRALGSTYRMLPAGVRLGGRYSEFRRLATEVESWDPERIAEFQTRQLRQSLIQAGNFCPFYQRRFAAAGFQPELLRGPDDLAKCPFTTKADLQQHLAEMTSTSVPAKSRLYITTGGSTGEPVGFHLHKGVSRPKEQAFLEAQWKRAGYTDGARLAVIRGHVTTDKAAGRIATCDATRDWLMLSSYHLTEDRLPEYLEALERFRPDLLHAYPSAALQLAEFLERSGQSWRLPLRGLLAGSERLTLPQKRLLERVFGCRVFRWYGHSERVVLAAEGRSSELFHFWPAYGYVEFGDADPDGFHEVIGTSFHNLAMPLVRYRTGDFVRLADPIRDGDLEFPWPAVAEIAGREQEFLVSRSGRRISLTAFNMHDSTFDGLYAVQFFQEEPGVAEFRYVASPAFHASRIDAVRESIARKLGDDFVVTLREVRDTEKTARGKHRWLVSKLARSGANPNPGDAPIP